MLQRGASAGWLPRRGAAGGIYASSCSTWSGRSGLPSGSAAGLALQCFWIRRHGTVPCAGSG
eukprot:3403646-Alexandrium_andersonii.AAC.1